MTDYKTLGEIKGFHLQSDDGVVGNIEDALLDVCQWKVRYLRARAGDGAKGKPVLVGSSALGVPQAESQSLPVELTEDEIKDALAKANPQESVEQGRRVAPAGNDHLILERVGRLWQGRELIGFGVHSVDGPFGEVDDLLLDPLSWQLRYLVVQTTQMANREKILLSVDWIQRVDIGDRKMEVGLLREEMQDSPRYDPSVALTRRHEEELYKFYGKRGYWEDWRIS